MPEKHAVTVLLSTVGNRDPHALDSGTEGSIITLTRKLQPDIVCLFPTAAQPLDNCSSTEDCAERTRAVIKEISPAALVLLRPLNLPDPTDYNKILRLLESEIAAMQKTLSESRQQAFGYHINLSSGTPQMQTCWLLLINGGRIKARVWQVRDPKWNTDRCRLIETEFIEEQNKMSRAQRFFHSYLFKAAQDELELLAAGTYLAGRAYLAEAMSELCHAYLLWDLFQHEKALKLVKKSYEAIKRFPEFKEINNRLAEQTDVLQQIVQSGKSETEISLLDLYHNAARRKSSGQFADCLARFIRLHEGCYYYYFRQALRINPTDSLGRQPKWVKDLTKTQGNFLSLTEWRNIAARQNLKDPVSPHLEEEIRRFRQQRNQSIAAHGMGSVTEEEAAESIKLASNFLLTFFPELNPDNYCFSEKALDELSRLLFKAL